MSIHPINMLALMILSLIGGFILGANAGIGSSAALGAEQSCRNLQVVILDCEKVGKLERDLRANPTSEKNDG
jgi:hypothetical protein